MYREIVGTDERVRAIPGVRDWRVGVTKVRLYIAFICVNLEILIIQKLKKGLCLVFDGSHFSFFQKFISPGELDPLNRRQVTEPKPDVVVQGKLYTPPDKRVLLKTGLLNSQRKHMLWVHLIMRQFF